MIKLFTCSPFTFFVASKQYDSFTQGLSVSDLSSLIANR